MNKLSGWDELLKNVNEERSKKYGNIIFRNISQEPFWRPKNKERTCSSGVRLGGNVWK